MIISHVLQMFASYLTHLEHVLGFVLFYASYFLYCLLKDAFPFPHSHQVYSCKYNPIFLYFTNFLLSHLSLCLSYNLSQAQNCSRVGYYLEQMVDGIRLVCDTPLFYSQHFIGKKINFIEKSKTNNLDYQNLLRIDSTINKLVFCADNLK